MMLTDLYYLFLFFLYWCVGGTMFCLVVFISVRLARLAYLQAYVQFVDETEERFQNVEKEQSQKPLQ